MKRLKDLRQSPNEHTGFLKPNPGTFPLSDMAFLLFYELPVTYDETSGDSTTLNVSLFIYDRGTVKRLDWISPNVLPAPLFLAQSRRCPE